MFGELDARKISGSAREALRRRGVALLREGELTHAQIAELLKVSQRTVARWHARWKSGGEDGLTEQRRGRRSVDQQALSGAVQERVIELMRGSNPDQLELGEGVLWSRSAVRALIVKVCGISLTRQTVGRYLRDWGFTKKKPAKRWLEQDPDRVQAWIDIEYPKIQAAAKDAGAKILWADEMGLKSGQTAGQSYAPANERATVKVTGKRFGVNVISAIGNDGTLLFEVFDGYGDDLVFMGFCDKLIEHHRGRPVFLIVDNHSIHKSRAVRAWQDDHPELTLFFLPPYAPEVNPDEYLNQDVHSHVARQRPRTRDGLREMTISYLKSRTPEIVKAYFRAPHIRYAASCNETTY